MKKKFAVLILFLVIPSAQTVQIEEIESYKADKKIEEVKSVGKSHFVTTEPGIFDSNLRKFSPDSQWKKKFVGNLFPETESNGNIIATGTHRSERIMAFYHNGTKILEKRLYPAYPGRRISLYEQKNRTLIGASGGKQFRLYSLEGDLKWKFRDGYHAFFPSDKLYDLDNDSDMEIMLDGRKGQFDQGQFKVLEINGKVDWKTGIKSTGVRSAYVPGEGILVYWDDRIELRTPEGKKKWEKKIRAEKISPVALDNFFIYSNSSHLIYRDYKGKRFKTREIKEEPREIKKFPERNLLAAVQGENLSLFSLKGKKIGSRRFSGIAPKLEFTQHDKDRKMELVLPQGKRLRIFDIGTGFKLGKVDSPKYYGFVGTDRQILKAIALNRTVFIGEEIKNFRNETDKKLVKVGHSLNDRTVTDPNEALNVSKPKYYVEDREKAVYLAGIASRNNAALTFQKKEATKDFTDKSLEELKASFIEEVKPNHIAVADLDSEKGLLTAYMGVKQGIMPLDFDEEYFYPGRKDTKVRRWNEYNGVIKLDRRIEERFERIGENQNTVWDGKYISLVEAPRRLEEDPVDKGIFNDPKDGEYFSSDLSYGDLDKDELLEAGVGRYPENTALASKIYHRSLARETDKRATVASEYLDTSWPVILSTAGGGLRYGTSIENLLKRQGFKTRHLVEYRADPLGLMMGLAPAPLKGFLDETKKIEDLASNFLKESVASSFRTVLIVIKGLNYAEQGLENFYEFRWHTAELQEEKGWEKIKDMDIPKGKTPEEIVQMSFMKAIYLSFWPDRHPKLNRTNLRKSMRDRDIIYYQGKGSPKKWMLPNYSRKNLYERTFRPEDIPELRNSVVWDSSNQAGKRDAEMRNRFLKQGASSHIGFSGLSYHGHSSVAAVNFFKKGKTLGKSLEEAVNSVKSSGIIYSPKNVHKTGLSRKTARSLVLYGNPEMKKDPIQGSKFKINRSCEATSCTVRAELNSPYKLEKVGNSTVPDFNTSRTLKHPGAPITPLYSLSLDLSEVEEIDTQLKYDNRSGLNLPEYSSIHDKNRSVQKTDFPFPEESWDYENSSRDLTVVLAGAKSYPNKTALLERAVLKIDYSPKAVVRVEKQEDSVIGLINSRERFRGKLIYRIGEEKISRNVQIEKGINRLKLGALEKGKTEVSVYLIDGKIVSKMSKNLKRQEDIKITLQKPEQLIEKEEKALEVNLENQNSFPVQKTLRISTDSKSRLGFMEKLNRSLKIGPEESESINIGLAGIKEGQTTLEIDGRKYNLSVEDKKDFNSYISLELFKKNFKGGKNHIKEVKKNSKSIKKLKTKEGKIKVSRSPNKLEINIKTLNFSASLVKKPDLVKRTAKDENSSIKILNKNGISKKAGGMRREKYNRYMSILEREAGKIMETK